MHRNLRLTLKINEDTDIAGDLGADSLDIVELIMMLEEEFGIVITDESIYEYKTVGEITSFIENIWEKRPVKDRAIKTGCAHESSAQPVLCLMNY